MVEGVGYLGGNTKDANRAVVAAPLHWDARNWSDDGTRLANFRIFAIANRWRDPGQISEGEYRS